MKLSRKPLRSETPTAAIGDIVFNLLIFFFILAKANDESHLRWVPATTPKVEPAGESRVSVLIDSKSKLYLNGREIGIATLSDSISDLLGNRPAGKRVVLLKVHHEAVAARFEPAVEAIAEAGGELVHILEENKQPKP